jgi:hypothetical protein
MMAREYPSNKIKDGRYQVGEAAPARSLRTWHYCVLSLPFMGLLWPPLYSAWSPEIFGIPFFYAYQFLWIFISSGLTALVYRSITK